MTCTFRRTASGGIKKERRVTHVLDHGVHVDMATGLGPAQRQVEIHFQCRMGADDVHADVFQRQVPADMQRLGVILDMLRRVGRDARIDVPHACVILRGA